MKHLFLITLLCLVFGCDGKQTTPGIPDKDIFRGVLSNDNIRVTPKGATIASSRSIAEALAPEVDAGLTRAFAIAQAPPNNYDLGSINHALYRVWVYARSPHCENPAFLVDATHSPYEGTVWDKDPSPNRCLICAAGMTVMQGETITGAGMVITDDIATMQTIVRYEAEHSILWYVDRARYNATMYHDENSGHPIMPDSTGSLAKSSPYKTLRLKAADSLAASKEFCVLVTK